jgi:hypothetical protein
VFYFFANQHFFLKTILTGPANGSFGFASPIPVLSLPKEANPSGKTKEPFFANGTTKMITLQIDCN